MRKLLNDCVERFLLRIAPYSFDILPEEGGWRRDYVCIVGHELLVEVGKACETPCVSNTLGDGPFE